MALDRAIGGGVPRQGRGLFDGDAQVEVRRRRPGQDQPFDRAERQAFQAFDQVRVDDQGRGPGLADGVLQQLAAEAGVDRGQGRPGVVGAEPGAQQSRRIGRPGGDDVAVADAARLKRGGGLKRFLTGFGPGPGLAGLEADEQLVRGFGGVAIHQIGDHALVSRGQGRVEPAELKTG
ncbi:hypothetical protein D3C87_1390510 [compost metagenome]